MLAPPGPVKVKVVVLMVAGFIAVLKVAVITAVLGQVTVEPVGGVTAVTVGGVRGLPGFAAAEFASGSLQPASRPATRNAVTQTLVNFNLRISFSPSTRNMAFHIADTCRRDL